MKSILLKISFLLAFVLVTTQLYSQENDTAVPFFMVRGSVINADDFTPISKVNIEITRGDYTTTNLAGEFTIRARVGDELVVRNTGFETVYYTIKDAQRIRIEVQSKAATYVNKSPRTRKNVKTNSFNTLITQAKAVYENDPEKAIDLVTKALASGGKRGLNSKQYGISYALLGTIYTSWGQPDLAVTNYELSLISTSSKAVQLDLANAYLLSKNYQEAITLYQDLETSSFSNKQQVVIQKGLGAAYTATGDLENAEMAYKKGLEIASTHQLFAEETAVNIALANVLKAQGSPEVAQEYIDASLETEADDFSLETKTKVQAADYYNSNQNFDSEIALRKSALEDIEKVGDTITSDDAITVQRQAYKIANAYAAKEDYDEAIPFFERSIKEASAKGDIVVEKDAQRRVSEVYKYQGEFSKALDAYSRYVALVDEDYVTKEQEINKAKRFGRDLAEKQNRISSLEKDRELNENRYEVAFTQQELTQSRDARQRIIIISLIVVALLLGVAAFAIYRNFRQQKYANNVLALKSLRSQMNPHFIFNALNSVNSFIATNDERTANRYLSDFSGLMRAVLENSEQDFIPLESEITLLKKYTMLEHFRFKDKFDYTFTVDDALAVQDFEIPPMLLQPYVENAVWHGMRYKEEKGAVSIRFAKGENNTAIITIEDNGVGRTNSKALKTDHQKKQQSKGMGNIKQRIQILNEMYGDRIAVAITDVNPDSTGTLVTLTLKQES